MGRAAANIWLALALPTIIIAVALSSSLKLRPTGRLAICGGTLEGAQKTKETLPEGLYIYRPPSFPNSHQTLLFSLLGTNPDLQSYIYQSAAQVRALNPGLRIIVIVQEAGLEKAREKIIENAARLRLGIVSYDAVANSSSLVQEFRKRFFVVSDMVPKDNNRDFVRLTIERLIAVWAVADALHLQHIYHAENDNMVYVNFDHSVEVMRQCNIGVGVPIININQAAISFAYFSDAGTLRGMVEFIVSMYALGRDELVKKVGTTFVSDMSIVYQYLARNFVVGGKRVEIMPTWIVKGLERNCLWERDKVIYDGAALGQFFGGTHTDPAARWYEEQRPFKELKDKKLDWRQCQNVTEALFCPYIDDRLVANLHIHSKELERFSSRLPRNKLPE